MYNTTHLMIRWKCTEQECINAVHDTLPTKVGDVQMNNFCQLCGHYIKLLGLMSLGSVDKVAKYSCHCSMGKQLLLI